MNMVLLIKLIFLLTACRNAAERSTDLVSFQRLVPDTINNSEAKQHYRNYYARTRHVENLLHLPTLENGSSAQEVRMWLIAGSYDPQVLFLLRKEEKHDWRLRVIQYQAFKNDSIQADYSVSLSDSIVNTFKLDQFWSLPSQSEMKDGVKYGCVDGFATLLEMADSRRYKYAVHICPDINVAKDSTFYKINLLLDQLDGAAIQHW